MSSTNAKCEHCSVVKKYIDLKRKMEFYEDAQRKNREQETDRETPVDIATLKLQAMKNAKQINDMMFKCKEIHDAN
jgi:hypothetical protein